MEEISKTNKNNKQLKDKVEVLEKVLNAMTRKVLNHETELKDIKKKRFIGNAYNNLKYKHVKGKTAKYK